MQVDLYSQSLLWFFALAVVFGAVAQRSDFCTMGAVSDWINIGSLNRMRSWMLAIATAIIGVGILEFSGTLDLGLTTSNETSTPPYRSATFIWLRHLLGGLMFGIGMTLASGCGNKTLVRIGGGNLKSIVVLAVMGLAAWWMLFTNFSFDAFLSWMMPLAIDFSARGIDGQDLPAVIFGLGDIERGSTHTLIVALAVALPLLYWVLRAPEFRRDLELLLAGLVIGLLIVIAWYVTAGPDGIALLEELDFAEQRPFFTGAQSFTFVGPAGHLAQYLKEGFAPLFLTFGVVTVAGVILGSLTYSLVGGKFRWEWFASGADFARHVVGGLLMGFGGVLAMGCTIGQGISGMSTLALGSLVTLVSIVAGSAATMKYQYYRMMRELD